MEYELVLNKLKADKSKIVMGMDHNLDLLKHSKHRPTREFIHINENTDLVLSITRLTRITNSSATLTDNIFVNNKYVRSLRSQILINDISDHLPTCTVLENVNIGLKEKRKIMTRNLTDKTINLIQNELQLINWDNYLETHCTDITNVDSVFNHVHNKICESVNIKEKKL